MLAPASLKFRAGGVGALDMALDPRLEDLCRERAVLFYRNCAGLDTRLPLQQLFERYTDALERLGPGLAKGACRDNDLTGVEGRLARARKRLAGHLWLAGRLAGPTQALFEAEALAVLRLPGRAPTLRQAGRCLEEQSGSVSLAQARSEALARLALLRFAPLREAVRAARDLGYSGYLDFWQTVNGVNLEEVAACAVQVLEATAGRYFVELQRQAPGWNGDPYALAPLLRVTELNERFPVSEMVPSLRRVLRSLGLEQGILERIRLDVEARPTKLSRAFYQALDVPGEVVVCLYPRGGLTDFKALYHEVGHALVLAGMDPALPMELRRGIEQSVTEGFAFLIEKLVVEAVPSLMTDLRLTPAEETRLRERDTLARLYLIRRYAALSLHQIEALGVLDHVEDGGAGEVSRPRWGREDDHWGDALCRSYVDRMGMVLGQRADPAEALFAVDPDLSAVTYLRGWMLEARLSRALSGRFGPRWWCCPETGRLLSDIFWEGAGPDIRDLLARLEEVPGLGPEALLEALPQGD